ncbi:MAG: alpha-galactosidase [Clostridiales bacterium]|nr:alpha-galactosidase [Clostridiales bacterium]
MEKWLTVDGMDIGGDLNGSAACEKAVLPGGEEVYTLSFSWDPQSLAGTQDPHLSVFWYEPCLNILGAWHPLCSSDRSPRVEWDAPLFFKTAYSAPVMGYYDDQDTNAFTVALSELQKEVKMNFGLHEENGTLRCHITIPLLAFGPLSSYTIRLYINRRPIPFRQALDRVRLWWEETCDIHPAAVPTAGREALYSTWYSFHQDVTAEKIEAECARAAELGLKMVIVDDGWQTNDSHRGYAYCGDWEPVPEKFPDMAAHVARIHALGMKYMLWYSVPFMGCYSRAWERFQDKFLSTTEGGRVGVLDPRYPEVRDYLKGTYLRALKEWDLDGFKLDFIDCFSTFGQAEQKPGMDFLCVQEALDFMMKDILASLRAIKPDILIEFRQAYIGPNMRQYGNLFRVGDCPNSFIRNRVGIADLRMLAGSSSVHSDMLMWHKDESVINSAIQIENSLFSTLQLSVLLKNLSPEHRLMVSFWLHFMEEHRHLLLEGDFIPENFSFLYPIVRAEEGDETVIARYSMPASVQIDAERFRRAFVVNATTADRTLLHFTGCRHYAVTLLDCCGREVSRETIDAAADHSLLLHIPQGGLAVLEG